MIYPNIRIEMERGGFTVHQLAAILGLPLNTLIYKLYGKCEFTLYEMECLADLFGCSLDYLVGIDKKEMVSIEKLSERQKTLVHTLLIEFRDDSRRKGLSPRQQDILSGLMTEFVEKSMKV